VAGAVGERDALLLTRLGRSPGDLDYLDWIEQQEV
jgi:hypothetical protein